MIRPTLLLMACAALAAQEPLLVYDVTFDDQPAGGQLRLVDFDGWAAAEQPGDSGLPLRAPRFLRGVTPTRSAQVVEQAAGLTRPAVLAFTDGEQPHWGPTLCFTIPRRLLAPDARWRVGLDAAKSTIAISGGVHLWDVCELEWHEDGTLRNNGTEVGRYAANRRQRLEFTVDGAARTVALAIDGVAQPVLPWKRPKGTFGELRVHGLLPGGHNEAPSAMMVDNIRIERLPDRPSPASAAAAR